MRHLTLGWIPAPREMTDYMLQVKGLIGQYVPPDPSRMQQAFQSGNVSMNPSPGMIQLVFSNYVTGHVPGQAFERQTTIGISE